PLAAVRHSPLTDYTEQWMRRRRILQTEDEWRLCDLPHQILRLFDDERVGKRRALLLTSACLRRLWHWPYQVERCHAVVHGVGGQAEGVATEREAEDADRALQETRLDATDVMGGLWWQASTDYTDHYLGDAWVTAWSTPEAMAIAAGRLVRRAAGLLEDQPD